MDDFRFVAWWHLKPVIKHGNRKPTSYRYFFLFNHIKTPSKGDFPATLGDT
jgi:hypothetical protein